MSDVTLEHLQKVVDAVKKEKGRIDRMAGALRRLRAFMRVTRMLLLFVCVALLLAGAGAIVGVTHAPDPIAQAVAMAAVVLDGLLLALAVFLGIQASNFIRETEPE